MITCLYSTLSTGKAFFCVQKKKEEIGMKAFFKKWGLLSAVFLVSMMIIVGCGTQKQTTQNETNGEKEVSQQEIVKKSGQSFPITLTDDAEREVTIEEKPETIVSIQTSSTEIAFALGLGDQIVGVSDYDNYPPEALEKEKVGAQDINVELVLTLLPDLALVTDYHHKTHPETLQQFEEAGINVIVIGSATSFEDVYRNIEMIGTATGSETEAERNHF